MKIYYCCFIFIAFFLSSAAQQPATGIDLEPLKELDSREEVSAAAILVPENHDAPEGKKIQISYVIIKAADSGRDTYPIIYFSGGPGGVAIDEGLINYLMDNPLRKVHDIILFDQRGTGFSSALPDMSFEAFDIMAENANSEEELELTRRMIAKYKQRCKAAHANPMYYNTQQNAKDVGMLFKHLGYKKYNLMGGSYGTRLGRVVQDMFPEFVHSAVLDSPAPLSGDFLLNRLESYSLALSRIFDYCDNSPECKSKYPQLKTDYFSAIDKLELHPLEVSMNDSVTVVVNAQDGIYLLRRLLYQANAREKAPELIHDYLNDGGKVLDQVLQFEYQLTSGLNLSMLLSVEKYENFDPSNTAAVIREHYGKYPLIPAKLGFFDAFYQAGGDWHQASMPIPDRRFRESDIPTLIFVNRFDPVTPPKNGYLFKEQLTNARLLVLDEGGHGGGNPDCKNAVILAFMNAPETPLDTSCLNLYEE